MKDIPPYCVVVGANGTGKTTLFKVFGFLKNCLTYNVRQALDSMGGFKEVISRGSDLSDTIHIELQFRMEIAGVNRLVTYMLEIGEEDSQPFVKREILRYKRAQYGSPFHFLDFANGSGYAITNEEDFNKADEELTRDNQTLDSDILAIKGLGQFSKFKAANAFRHLIENWHISDFHISEARGAKDIAGYSEHLSASGDNLQRVARHIFERHRDVFDTIVKKMEARVPGISNVSTELTQDGRLLLKFGDRSFTDPFIDRYVSDGTIKMFAYLVLLHDPKPHPVLCVEEPENQLYPALLEALSEEFEAYADKGGQVFVSTHSPDFLNAVGIESVFLLSKSEGYTQINRARDDEQLVSFMNAGDKMGYLWKQGLFEGVDP